MILDKVQVFAGDKLHDVGMGTKGCVIEVTSSLMRLRFDTGITHTYNKAGRRIGNPGRLLFWQNPVFITPSAVYDIHVQERNALQGVSQAIRGALNMIQGCCNAN